MKTGFGIASHALKPPLILCSLLLAFAPHAHAQFASRVLAYDPAPGQFVQNPAFNDPSRSLAPPPSGLGDTGGLFSADNSKVVTLGGFGGSITLAFDQPIWRNRRNPRGLDVIVFGNAFFVGAPALRFAEPGVIEIARDDNANALPDDPWFLIPGSHLTPPLTPTTRTYDTAQLDPAIVPPGRSGTWTVSAFALPTEAFPSFIIAASGDAETVFGYADIAPTLRLGDTDADNLPDDPNATPALFYTAPDDPRAVGISPGSGGGSAFAIADAINPATGAPANLDRIHFVRITNALNRTDPVLGESSTEISGVADVRPVYTADWNADGAISVQDLFDFLADWFAGLGEGGGADFNASGATSVQDIFDFLGAWFIA